MSASSGYATNRTYSDENVSTYVKGDFMRLQRLVLESSRVVVQVREDNTFSVLPAAELPEKVTWPAPSFNVEDAP